MTTRIHVRELDAADFSGAGTKALHDDGTWKAVGGGAGGGGGWALLDEHVFATAGAGYTFTVPAGYGELRLLVIGRTDEASTRGTLEVVFNGDTTAANYKYRRELDTAGTGNANLLGLISGATSGFPSVPTISEWRIPAYAGTTWDKVATGQWTIASPVNGVGSLSWANTAAITSLRVQARASTGSKFIAGSIVRLYAL